MFTVSVLSGLWAAAACQADDPVGANLVQNPSFEEGEQTPSGWAFNHRGTDGEIAWDRSRAHTGGASVRITNQTRAQTGNVLQTIRLDPPLEPGCRVTFSALAAAENAADGPRIIFNLLSTSTVRQDASASCSAGTHDFIEVRGEAVAERPTDRLVIYLCQYSTGTVWWDDAMVSVQRAQATAIVPRPESRASVASLETGDGLGLALADSGAVAGLSLDEQALPGPASHSGLWLRPFGGDTVPVSGVLQRTDDGATQQFSDPKLNLRVEATLAARDDLIECSGTVEDLSREDRGVDVIFGLPVGEEAWRWGKSIREEVPLAQSPHAVEVTTFSSVGDPETGRAIALAVPPDSPCDCEFTYDEDFGYAVRFRFGLSPDARGELECRAPFRFVLYRCDGRWGLRDAARRYYQLFPEAFTKRATHEGLWMFGSPRFEIPDPGNYAFHEGGPGGWEYDDEHGIYTCPYIIPGQREITRLDKLPANKQEALEVFRSFEPTDSERGGGWGADLKQIVENCLLHDAQGLPQMRIRNTPWGGNSITFPLNANPRLFEDSDKLTVAKSLLAHVAALHEETPGLDGTYVDSLGAWGEYVNYRPEHFAYAQVPLTYAPGTGRPVIANRSTLLEFLWALRHYLHERGKLLFANGVHQNRRFHFFALDVMGVEGHGWLEQKRAMAYRKPFLLLIYSIHDNPGKMEHYFHLCTFYGIYPSFANMRVYETPEMYAPVAALNDRFVPALRAITGAGWQPITGARSLDADVWLERWGPDAAGTAYITAYNSASEDRAATITLQASDLGLTGDVVTLEDLLSDDKWDAAVRDGSASVELSVPAEEVRVLRLGRSP